MLPAMVKTVTASLCLAATTHLTAVERGSQYETWATNPGWSVAQSESQRSTAMFEGIGIITGIEPETDSLTVDHEEIKGFMAAMEMAYPVAQPGLLDNLEAGDRIRFVIDKARNTITAVTVLSKGK